MRFKEREFLKEFSNYIYSLRSAKEVESFLKAILTPS